MTRIYLRRLATSLVAAGLAIASLATGSVVAADASPTTNQSTPAVVPCPAHAPAMDAMHEAMAGSAGHMMGGHAVSMMGRRGVNR